MTPDKDPFTIAYEEWEQSNDPKTRQFRPDAATWAASHQESIPDAIAARTFATWIAEWFEVGLWMIGGVGAYLWTRVTGRKG